MRNLSPDEQQLWQRVTSTIRPLSREPLPERGAPPVAKEMEVPPERPATVRGRVPPAPPAPRTPAPVRTLQSATLDGGWDRRLRAGSIQPDRTLDLHGHSLDAAWFAIDQALERAIASGDRILLLITGHERKGEPPVVRGRIRAAVNDWLASSPHASHIAAVRGAHRRHGGGGSLYIILRRS